MSLISIAASYGVSEQAKRDKLNNLLAWRDDPSPFKLEALALYYIDNKKYKELKALCLDAEYIIASAQAFPNRPNFYKDIAKHFLFKQATTHELAARVSLLEKLFYTLAMQNMATFEMATFEEELFDYIDENLTNNVRDRFCFLLIIYTKWLLDKKQVNPHMSERLTRLVGLLKVELASGYEFNEQMPDSILNPEKKDIKELIELCYPVILDFDFQLILSLSELMEVKKDELIILLSILIKKSNQKAITHILQRTGRFDLAQLNPPTDFDFQYRSSPIDSHPLIFIKNLLKILILYEKTDVLTQEELSVFQEKFKEIIDNHDCLTQEQVRKIIPVYQHSPLEILRDHLVGIIFQPGCRTEFYRYFVSILEEYLPYSGKEPYSFTINMGLALTQAYSFKETVIRLRQFQAWGELSNFKRFYIIFLLKAFSENSPAIVQLQTLVPEIEHMKIWKLSWLLDKVALLIGKPVVNKKEPRKIFKFKKKIYYELKDIANNYFAGGDKKKVLQHTLIGYRSGRSINSVEDLIGTKGQKLKKKIVLLCQMKKGSCKNKITSRIAYPYEEIPHGINSSKPKLPFFLPYKYIKSARQLFSKLRKDFSFDVHFMSLSAYSNLFIHQYIIPRMVYYRFFCIPPKIINFDKEQFPSIFYIPPEIINFDKEQFPSSSFFLTKYYRCWQLKRAMAYMEKRQSYKKEIQKNLNNYVEKVKRRF